MASTKDRIETLAARHGLSPDAAEALAEALRRSGGGAAQWNHPGLGGMGQWLAGGMIQIGDMFDADLRRRVGAAIAELAQDASLRAHGRDEVGSEARSGVTTSSWWPHELGRPAATGAQNAMRYAVFPATRRLAVEQDGTITVYDTGDKRLTGVAQAQGAARSLRFSGPDGAISLSDLSPLG